MRAALGVLAFALGSASIALIWGSGIERRDDEPDADPAMFAAGIVLDALL